MHQKGDRLLMLPYIAPNQVQNVSVMCAPVDLDNECIVAWNVSNLFCNFAVHYYIHYHVDIVKVINY